MDDTEIARRATIFGSDAAGYDEARRPFPPFVFELAQQLLGTMPSDLPLYDVGCGTGIATRILATLERRPILGFDADERMLEVARCREPRVHFAAARASSLPVRDSSGAGITCFSSFHWFAQDDTVREFRRALVPHGLVFIANKIVTGGVGVDYKHVIERLSSWKIIDMRRSGRYEPAALLARSGCSHVTDTYVPFEESYTVREAVAHIHSTSVWKHFTDHAGSELRTEAENEIRNICERSSRGGHVTVPMQIRIVHAVT